jgi:TldD protein
MSLSLDLGKEVLGRALDRGADEAVVRLQERVYELVVFDSGVLRSYSVLRVVGLGVEVLVSGFVGYAYTSTLSRESIGQAIDKAMKLAKALSARGREVGLARVEGVKALYRTRYAQNPLEVDPSEKVSLVRDLNTIAMGLGA